VYTIKAKLSKDKVPETVLLAALDTQCEGEGLLSYDAWERLNRHSNYSLVPCPGDTIHPLLQSESHDKSRILVIGKARDVIWTFLRDSRTYTSNFFVVRMGKYDVIIGQETIQKYGLIRPEVDVPPFRFKVKESPASEETKTANNTTNETTNKAIDKTREETFSAVDQLDATAMNSGFDSGYKSMSNTVLNSSEQGDDKNSIRSILTNASRVRLPPQEEEQLISVFVGDLCQDIGFCGDLNSTHDRISARLPDLLNIFTLRLEESVNSEAERNAKEFFRQQRE
jgi:hypothetical protein